jgi:hypothetical protein
VLAGPGAGAQEGPRLTLVAGVSQFDLSGTGDAFTVALRFDAEITPVLVWEATVGVTPDAQDIDDATLVIPEAQVQLQWPARLSPYIGGGGGISLYFKDEASGGTDTEPTFSGAVGVRFALAEQAGMRGELRVRGIGTDFAGSTAEWTAGISYRF